MTGSVSGRPAELGTPPWVAGDRPILAPRPVWGPRSGGVLARWVGGQIVGTPPAHG